MSTDPVFSSAARAFAELIREIPESGWAGPGLGEWDLRALVGHTSRSLITVSQYLKTPAESADISSAAGYYALIRNTASTFSSADIVERGRQAGRHLGDDPIATVDGLVDRALADVAAVEDPLITVIGGSGIRLHDYLPTRVFELAVHSLDIARAVELEFALPPAVLEAAATLAARIAVVQGHGQAVLTALTGRTALPPSFSVV